MRSGCHWPKPFWPVLISVLPIGISFTVNQCPLLHTNHSTMTLQWSQPERGWEQALYPDPHLDLHMGIGMQVWSCVALQLEHFRVHVSPRSMGDARVQFWHGHSPKHFVDFLKGVVVAKNRPPAHATKGATKRAKQYSPPPLLDKGLQRSVH